jgi:uncharacterized SAM-binding protein YcdF (DUF218 family)
LLHRQHTIGKAILLSGVLALFIVSWPPLVPIGAASLEYQYRREPADDRNIQAIIVLASNVIPPSPQLGVPLADRDTYERCVYAAAWHRRKPDVPILACGGGGSRLQEPFARTLAHVLRSEGVPEEMIWTEEQSRSTHENALYAAEILRRKGLHRILLVTEGYHKLRAEKCFRMQGLEVVPAPANLREWDFELEDLFPSAGAIRQNERSLHEWIALVFYKARGWL